MLEKIYWRFIEGLVKRKQLNKLVGLVTDYMVIDKADKIIIRIKPGDDERYLVEEIVHRPHRSEDEVDRELVRYNEMFDEIFDAVKAASRRTK